MPLNGKEAVQGSMTEILLTHDYWPSDRLAHGRAYGLPGIVTANANS